ncbi:MAG: TrkH family potassium uptake protein [Firmicutes bacterium]|nr:TrkH family potassium uptake protein [Bacillota bacterium]
MLRRINPQQALVLSFLTLIGLGTLLLSTPWATVDGSRNLLTSFFTAVSAVCVTGLVVEDTGTYWSFFGQLVILLLIQVGGLGVMSFATFFALLLGRRIRLRQRLIMQQELNKPSVRGIVEIFRYLLLFSFLMEALGALVLAARWEPEMGLGQALWFGVFHSVSAFNNAGFDIFGNWQSLTGYAADPVVNITIATLFVVGGLGFIVMYEIYNYRREKILSMHARLVLIVTLLLIFVGTLVILALENNHALRDLSPAQKLMAACFQAVTPRTAGFNTLDLHALYLPTHLLIMLFMFVGGSPGSTAGGIKTSTFALLGAAIYSILRGKRETELLNRRIAHEDVLRALSIALLVLFLIGTVTFLLSFTHDRDLIIVLFEVVSALGTVGLSLGLTPELSDPGRVLIAITMFLGRVGPITIGYALAYRPKQPEVRHPEGRIMIG